MSQADDRLLRRGLRLEYLTLGWNVVGCGVLLVAAASVGSLALAGFGVDSMIEIVASAVVIWHLKGTASPRRERLALRVIAAAFALLALYIAAQITRSVLAPRHPGTSPAALAWLALTVIAMLALAMAKNATGQATNNAVLRTEARVTLVDAALAAAVLVGVTVNAVVGLWLADALAATLVLFYSVREAGHAWTEAGRSAVPG